MRCLGVLLLLACLAGAQPRFYQFGVDQDGLSGAPDFSALNRPLSPADRIFVRDGHFFRLGEDLRPNTADDQRVDFFGMNLAFSANFPAAGDAARIAKRLRRLGVNLVRLHHLDTQPDNSAGNAGSILMAAPYPALNNVAAARLRTFLTALAAEGIYCNLNLAVGYTFNSARDGVPPLSGGKAMPSQSKPLRIFHPRMVELQADFTRRVIEALGLKNDPVLAMAEISNEASMLQHWQWNQLDEWLSGEYRTILESQWNDYLGRKYESTAALRQAWSGGSEDGPELLTGDWRLEVHSPSQAALNQTEGRASVNVSRGGATVIVKQVGFSVAQGKTYTAEVELRADLPNGVVRNVYWDIKQDVSPWRTVTGRTVQVTNQWQRFSALFTPQFEMNGIGRFGLSVEAVEGTVYVQGAALRLAGRRGLGEGETLESRNVSLVREGELGSDGRMNDWVHFLMTVDKAYLDTMLAAVRGAANPLVPVAGTQMGYGGLMNFDSHASLDYQDHHFYVDHYSFPHTSWDGRDWRFRDTSSVGSGLREILNVAAAREAGRPYTVSEFNQPWPNTYAAEIDPLLAVIGAFQDWDSIMHFAYAHARNWDDGVPNGFNINGDWAKFPNIGQSAWLFRTGVIERGPEIEIPVSAAARIRATREKWNGNIASFLGAAMGYDPAAALEHRVSLRVAESGSLAEALKRTEAPYRAGTGQFTYDAERRRFLIHARMAAGVYGFLDPGTTVTSGVLKVERGVSSRGFISILLTPLDGRPIVESGRMLLSNPGYALRSQPAEHPARPQQIVRYPSTNDWWTLEPEPAYPAKQSGNLNGGVTPAWMERVEAVVTIETSAKKMRVFPLSGSGRRSGEVAAEAVEGGFRVHLQADGEEWSPWYEICAEGAALSRTSRTSSSAFVAPPCSETDAPRGLPKDYRR
jgi:hypothetical protein